MANTLESKIEREGNITTITKPEGKYILNYGNHEIPRNPKSIPIGIDGLVLEFGKLYNDSIRNFNYFLNYDDFQPFLSRIKNEKIPVYFTDIDVSELYVNYYSSQIDYHTTISENLRLTCSKLENLNYHLDNYLRKQNLETLNQKEKKKLANLIIERSNIDKDIIKSVFPDFGTILFDAREFIMAQKQYWLSKQLNTPKKYVFVLGASHIGMENALSFPEDKRMKNLETLMPLIKNSIDKKNISYQSLYKIIHFEFINKRWKYFTYEVPELKELFAK